jgi:hypothetical protein
MVFEEISTRTFLLSFLPALLSLLLYLILPLSSLRLFTLFSHFWSLLYVSSLNIVSEVLSVLSASQFSFLTSLQSLFIIFCHYVCLFSLSVFFFFPLSLLPVASHCLFTLSLCSISLFRLFITSLHSVSSFRLFVPSLRYVSLVSFLSLSPGSFSSLPLSVSPLCLFSLFPLPFSLIRWFIFVSLFLSFLPITCHSLFSLYHIFVLIFYLAPSLHPLYFSLLTVSSLFLCCESLLWVSSCCLYQ